MSGIANIPVPQNEPVLSYAPGTGERAALRAAYDAAMATVAEIPVVVNGTERATGATVAVTSPHRHRTVLAQVHQAGEAEIREAADAACAAQAEWQHWSFADRASVFLKAAELSATKYRALLNATTMAGQGKTVVQAEIDAACEWIDFLRFNVAFAERLYAEQPRSSAGIWNRTDHRPLEGFVYAVTPFNFTAIGGNLAAAPALLGNAVVWKPAPTAALSNWVVFEILREAGLPPGVINFVPGDAPTVSRILLADPRLAGIHFTGSTAVFRQLWQGVASNLGGYRSYPRLVGETGGKDFVLAHASADVEALVVGLLRGAYEYQGQKCSAASRAYIPQSLWPRVKSRLQERIAEIRMGDVGDFSNFMGAVIDQRSFTRLRDVLAAAKADPNVTVLAGGGTDDSEGWFVQPTLLEAADPSVRFMCEEYFGPILTVHVYPDAQWAETLALVDRTGPYALTGAVFAQDRRAIIDAMTALRHAAGNFYVNDKPTGAVVGQQPFGGGRASGTNDKAGGVQNLLRWVSPRSIKETLVPPTEFTYPHML
jgi:1-pyrroline-5-carboxylate dehydrogenase